jgi:hypothetical protein
MHVTIELPDEFAQRLQTKWKDTLEHYVRERLVMEAYRDDLLSTREVQELLGLDDSFAVYYLCKKYDIVLYTPPRPRQLLFAARVDPGRAATQDGVVVNVHIAHLTTTCRGKGEQATSDLAVLDL